MLPCPATLLWRAVQAGVRRPAAPPSPPLGGAAGAAAGAADGGRQLPPVDEVSMPIPSRIMPEPSESPAALGMAGRAGRAARLMGGPGGGPAGQQTPGGAAGVSPGGRLGGPGTGSPAE